MLKGAFSQKVFWEYLQSRIICTVLSEYTVEEVSKVEQYFLFSGSS